MVKRHPHTPAHLFLDDTPYFVTAAIYQKRPVLKNPELKHQLHVIIQEHCNACGWELHHWVILDNHYHVLGKSRDGNDLTTIFKGIHGNSARVIREATHCDLPVWWNFWDYCPRNEDQYLTRLNYLLYNPIKHGYVTDLRDYAFSSFHELLEQYGRTVLAAQFQRYSGFKMLRLREAYDDDF
jgi:putative transposase